MRNQHHWSIRRLARTFEEPVSSIGRWIRPVSPPEVEVQRRRPVRGDPALRRLVKEVSEEPRYRTYGYRRIWAQLHKQNVPVSRRTVRRIMKDLGLSRPKVWHRLRRPKRVEKMRPSRPNEGWQIDMTVFVLSDMSPVYLVMVVDCCTREIVGYTLDRRCRAGEWVSAVRQALESRGLTDKTACEQAGLVLRSDNGSQPCSKRFVEYLGFCGVRGQYTGYDAPDDNAYVERVIRTVKEEEIWPNLWDTLGEARQAIEAYVNFYNNERIHSALDYKTPAETAAAHFTLTAA